MVFMLCKQEINKQGSVSSTFPCTQEDSSCVGMNHAIDWHWHGSSSKKTGCIHIKNKVLFQTISSVGILND